jgi:hypothetical protein
MEDYTKEEVIKELSSLDQKTRKRNVVDQRSYLIGILHQKFGLSEHAIAKLTGLKREKVNYNRRLPVQFKDDVAYKKNVYVYAQLFPFDFSKSYAIKSQRQRTIQVVVDDKLFKKLTLVRDLFGHKDVRTTIAHLLEKSMKLWAE